MTNRFLADTTSLPAENHHSLGMDNTHVDLGRTGNQLARGILTPSEALAKVIADVNATGHSEPGDTVTLDAYSLQTILIASVDELLLLERSRAHALRNVLDGDQAVMRLQNDVRHLEETICQLVANRLHPLGCISN